MTSHAELKEITHIIKMQQALHNLHDASAKKRIADGTEENSPQKQSDAETKEIEASKGLARALIGHVEASAQLPQDEGPPEGFRRRILNEETRKILSTYFEADENPNERKLEDGRLSKLEFSKLATQEYGLLFFSVSGIVLCIISVIELSEQLKLIFHCMTSMTWNSVQTDDGLLNAGLPYGLILLPPSYSVMNSISSLIFLTRFLQFS